MNQSAKTTAQNIQIRLDDAFANVPRVNFLPEQHQNIAHVNLPVPIGFNQTNSQPSTIYKMLKWLDPQPGQKVLDVGSGSGWTTALLANLVGNKGHVHAVEKIPALVQFGQQNCAELNIKNASFHHASSTLGLLKKSPFDRILVSAAAAELPQELIDQLAIGGRMIIPVKNSIFIVRKTGPDSHFTQEEPGFAFVPLVNSKGERI